MLSLSPPSSHSCHRIDINIYAKSISSAISHINTSTNIAWKTVCRLNKAYRTAKRYSPSSSTQQLKGSARSIFCISMQGDHSKKCFVKAAFALILKSNKRKERERKYGNAVCGEEEGLIFYYFTLCYGILMWFDDVSETYIELKSFKVKVRKFWMYF